MSTPTLDYRDPPGEPAAFYAAMYAGEIVRFSGLAQMADIVAFTRAFVEERLAPYPPIEIHRHLEPDLLASRLGEVKRDYTQSPKTKRLWKALFEGVGLDPEDTVRDRLMLRFQVHSDPGAVLPWSRNTATVGFHRDSWGTSLCAQINWWAPVWPITAERTFAIHPGLWDVAVPNNSADFDLAVAMEKMRTAPQALRPGDFAPGPTQPIGPEGGVPVVLDPGEIIAFSSAHAHVGVPNHTGLTRVSLETRTVSIADVRARRGAPDVDGQSRWVAPGMFHRLSDGTALNTLLGCERLVPRAAW